MLVARPTASIILSSLSLILQAPVILPPLDHSVTEKARYLVEMTRMINPCAVFFAPDGVLAAATAAGGTLGSPPSPLRLRAGPPTLAAVPGASAALPPAALFAALQEQTSVDVALADTRAHPFGGTPARSPFPALVPPGHPRAPTARLAVPLVPTPPWTLAQRLRRGAEPLRGSNVPPQSLVAPRPLAPRLAATLAHAGTSPDATAVAAAARTTGSASSGTEVAGHAADGLAAAEGVAAVLAGAHGSPRAREQLDQLRRIWGWVSPAQVSTRPIVAW